MSESLKAKLAKLQELLELGYLTQEEFDAERRQVVDEMMGRTGGGALSGATRVAR